MLSTAKANQVYTEREQMIQFWARQLDQIVEKEGEDLEGNCFYHGNTRMTSWFFLYKKINFVNVLLDNNVKKMIEIGFNAGHSGVVFLSALPKDGSILFFDLNDHKYAKPCYNLLKASFSQVKDFIAGDSRETIKKYLQDNPNEVGTFDCVHVDGGHSKEVALSDVAYSDILLRKGGIMILDDTQLKDIENLIPMLLENKYTFVYQIPTYGFSHVCLMKN